MAEDSAPHWTFLTNHAQVLVCIANDPGVRLREIGQRVGITERAAHRIVGDLAAAGYITRQRNGRRNQYTINAHLPLHDPIAREQNVGQLPRYSPRLTSPDVTTTAQTSRPLACSGGRAAHSRPIEEIGQPPVTTTG